MVVGGRRFAWGERTFIMAIINVTPDSFSGDGIGSDVTASVRLARAFEAAGADILDIGGESTRPGASALAPEEEMARVLPALCAIREATSLPLSVDTCHATVARAALEAGASIVNDITGLRGDCEMAGVAAGGGAALVAMHNQRGKEVHDVVGDIAAGFEVSLKLAADAGIGPGRVILDPGFGFGWTPEQNLEMVRRLPELGRFELPLLIGPSRKSTIGFVLDVPVKERLEGTSAAVALAIAGGADIVRVHDVREMRRVCLVADAIVRGNWRAKKD
jgi:dihydropteroate synthase